MHQVEARAVHGSSSPSHVLKAIGNNEQELKGAIRVTFGMENTKQDVDYLVDSLIKIIKDVH